MSSVVSEGIQALVVRRGADHQLLFRRESEGCGVASLWVHINQHQGVLLAQERGSDDAVSPEPEPALRSDPTGWQALPLAEARLLLGRAILATRVAGRELPPQIALTRLYGGTLAQLLAGLQDVYACTRCLAPLELVVQLELARSARRTQAAELPCQACGAASRTRLSDAPGWVMRAQLMLSASRPLEALRVAREAARTGARESVVARVCAAAQLALGNATQAAMQLRFVLSKVPSDEGAWAMLREAEARCALMVVAAEDPEADIHDTVLERFDPREDIEHLLTLTP